MNDFEEAVETATLPQFLKQDIDLPTIPTTSSSTPRKDNSANLTSTSNDPKTVEEVEGEVSGGNTSQTIQEYELEKLMREMSDADLDTLVSQLSVDDSSPSTLSSAAGPSSTTAGLGKIGLMVEPKESVEEVTRTELGPSDNEVAEGAAHSSDKIIGQKGTSSSSTSIVESVVKRVEEVTNDLGETVVKLSSVVAGIDVREIQGDGGRGLAKRTVDETIADSERAEGKEKVD